MAEETSNILSTISVGDSILKTVRKMVGPSHECDVFDVDLIVHINTVFAELRQLGVGPVNGFEITDDTSTWSEFIGTEKKFNPAKSYMYLKTRLMFDPPASSVILSAMENQVKELSFRLNVDAESNETE